jgi:hypothetical protein
MRWSESADSALIPEPVGVDDHFLEAALTHISVAMLTRHPCAAMAGIGTIRGAFPPTEAEARERCGEPLIEVVAGWSGYSLEVSTTRAPILLAGSGRKARRRSPVTSAPPAFLKRATSKKSFRHHRRICQSHVGG